MYLKRENLLHLYEIISNRIFDPSISQNGNILDPFVGGHLKVTRECHLRVVYNLYCFFTICECDSQMEEVCRLIRERFVIIVS